jgi:hypothetical protein
LAARHFEHGWKPPPDALTCARDRFQTSDGSMNLRPLRHRDFSLLWWAGLISLTGTWATRVALPIYVLAVAGVVGAALAGCLGGTVHVRTVLTVQASVPSSRRRCSA